jgi:hypothetical protein
MGIGAGGGGGTGIRTGGSARTDVAGKIVAIANTNAGAAKCFRLSNNCLSP